MVGARVLDTDAERVYRAMLRRPEFDIDDLVEHLSIAAEAVRSAQEILVAIGLIRPSREETNGLRAIHPEHGLQILAARQEAELAQQRIQHEQSRRVLIDLAAEFAALQARAAAPQGERFFGLDSIQSKLEALTLKASTEVSAIVPGGPQPVAALNASRPLDEALARRGVTLRSLCQDSVRSDSTHLAYAQSMATLGMQVRTLPTLPPRLIIVDRETAISPIAPESPGDGIVVLHEPGIVRTLICLFDLLWDTAVSVTTEVIACDKTKLTPSERELLQLLGSGSTDEAAAKRLGVSLRTVRRMMAALMERLDASSRFEAGLNAGKRGWL
jgi:sugar-specific transcriptional regulator TrmB